MKRLILCEKHSVANDFFKTLKPGKKGNGYFETDEFLITWSQGHLFQLLEPHQYDPKWKRWSLDALPILPLKMGYSPILRTQGQLKNILSLLKRNDIESIIVATDAGREGELIARIILREGKLKKIPPCYRFWTSLTLTPEVIKKNLSNLPPLSKYDHLYKAGICRQWADWLVGMNLSRMSTIYFGTLFSVGRVQTAVLALLVDRKHQRDNFVVEPYFDLKAKFKNEKGVWEGTLVGDDKKIIHLKDEKKAKETKDILNRPPDEAFVKNIKKNDHLELPPKLYSLTDLQKDANRIFKMTANETLNTAQVLYERHKVISYPRSDSKVMGEANISLVENIVRKLKNTYRKEFEYIDFSLFNSKYRHIFNDAKLTDHHALIPLKPFNGHGREYNIYMLIVKRLAAAFSPPFEYQSTQIETSFKEHLFLTKGRIIKKMGWKEVYNYEEKDVVLPPLEKSEQGVREEIKIIKKETSPPPLYTDALLLSDMTNPGRLVDQKELKDIYRGDVGLGTQSTRAQIMETLIKRDYVTREKRNLLPTDKGVTLIELLRGTNRPQVLTRPQETAHWELLLQKISQGQCAPIDFVKKIEDFIKQSLLEFYEKSKNAPISINRNKSRSAPVGKCPQCGKEVSEWPKSYGCVGFRDKSCNFTIWKTIAKKKISLSTAQKILSKGHSSLLSGFTSKKGGKFQARLVLKREDQKIQVTFSFE